MKEPTRHLSWENFQSMITRAVPAVHQIPGDPIIYLFVDERANRIGLRTSFPRDMGAPNSPLAVIAIEVVWSDGARMLEIATSQSRLYSEFYSLCVTIADRIQLKHESPVQAVLATLANWRELLRPVGALPIERQLGLIGELWLLWRLVADSVQNIRSWTGPMGEPHDFRVKDLEFEVKVTLAPTRSHMVNGEQQLLASPGHDLWILSLQLEPAGTGGISLPELVDEVRSKLAVDPADAAWFDAALVRVGYREFDRNLYDARWQFRTEPRLIPVDEKCPKITRLSLEMFSPLLSDRLSDVHYRVNLHGLGYGPQAFEYQQALPIGQGGLDVRT
jgi:hypothetical protein